MPDPVDKLVAALEEELGDELVVAGAYGFRVLIGVTQSRVLIPDKTNLFHAVSVEAIRVPATSDTPR
ncbi:MAG: hypothetical protein ACKOAW_08075 [Actinomycetota bacterium]